MKARSIAASLLAVIAAPAIARVAPVPPATPAGAPVSCVRPTQIRDSRVRNDQIIDFYMRDGKVYRNTLPFACSRLGFERTFSYQVTNNQLCSVDIIRVFDRALRTPGVGCGLGQFQPVTGLGR